MLKHEEKELLLPNQPFFIRIPFMEPYWKSSEWIAIVSSLFLRKDFKNRLINEIKSKFNTKYVVLVGNARVGGYIGIKALNLKPGDEIIIPSFFCRTLAQAIVQSGCIPHYVDIDDDFNMNIDSIRSAINHKTKAIIMVNMFGKIANYKKINKIAKDNNLFLIDDSAVSLGGKRNNKFAGTLGDFGLISFNMGKNVNATGGGALLTNSKKLYTEICKEKLKKQTYLEEVKKFWYVLSRLKLIKLFSLVNNVLLKLKLKRPSERDISKIYRKTDHIPENYAHTQDIPTRYQEASYSDLTKEVVPKDIGLLQAQLAFFQIKRIEQINKDCEKNAKLLTHQLIGTNVKCPNGTLPEHTYSYYTIVSDNRFDLANFLGKMGIATQWTFYPLHLQEKFCSYPKEDLSNTERLWKGTLSLPINPNVTKKQILYIANSIKEFERIKNEN